MIHYIKIITNRGKLVTQGLTGRKSKVFKIPAQNRFLDRPKISGQTLRKIIQQDLLRFFSFRVKFSSANNLRRDPEFNILH